LRELHLLLTVSVWSKDLQVLRLAAAFSCQTPTLIGC